DFIGGCPDRPVVLGRVYNANNMPPVELPASATQSGFRSQSVYGDPSMCNKMIFEDALGCELVHMRAQKDMCDEVVNDHSHSVGCNYAVEVGEHYSIKAKTLTVEICEDTNVTLKDRKSTRLNSSHVKISYAVFCLKKKKRTQT